MITERGTVYGRSRIFSFFGGVFNSNLCSDSAKSSKTDGRASHLSWSQTNRINKVRPSRGRETHSHNKTHSGGQGNVQISPPTEGEAEDRDVRQINSIREQLSRLTKHLKGGNEHPVTSGGSRHRAVMDRKWFSSQHENNPLMINYKSVRRPWEANPVPMQTVILLTGWRLRCRNACRTERLPPIFHFAQWLVDNDAIHFGPTVPLGWPFHWVLSLVLLIF